MSYPEFDKSMETDGRLVVSRGCGEERMRRNSLMDKGFTLE